ncbi:MAG: CHAT domain-containing protein [Saprospiraceae bacterium]|nr:CHAT domain-containing protein [Saprospiraceae bacterium]
MKPLHNVLAILIYSSVVWSITFLLSIAQTDSVSLHELYQKLMHADGESLKGEGDSLVQEIFNANQQTGLHDSLVSVAINHYCREVCKAIPLKDRLPILQAGQKLFDKLSLAPIEQRAELANQFVIHLRQSSQVDSLAIYLRKMRLLLDQLLSPSELEINLAYENARYAYLQNDFLASITFLQNGLQYLEEFFPGNLRMKINFLNGIGVGYRRTNQLQLGIEHHHRTLKFLADRAPGSSWEGLVLNNLGLCHSDLGQNEEAIFFMKKAIASYEFQGEHYRNEIATGHDNIAVAFRDLGQIDSALAYSNHALRLMRQYYSPDYPDQLLPLSTLTETYYKDQQLARADSMSRISIDFLKTLGWSVEDPHGDYFLTDALNLLATSVQINHALFEESQEIQQLKASVEIGKAYMATIDYAYDGILNSGSRDIFKEKSRKIFSLAIDDLLKLYHLTSEPYWLDLAFNYIEKYKSIELLQVAQKDKIQEHRDFKQLNEEQSILKDSVYLLEKALVTSNDSEDRRSLNLALEKLYNWRQLVKASHPRYHDLINHPEPLTITDVQQTLLSHDRSILSYHVAENDLYLLAINQSEARFEKIAVNAPISQMIEDLRDNVFAYHLSGQKSEQLYSLKTEQFIESSFSLYEILIGPVNDFLKERVLVIPDKSLGYLPFDLLLAERPSNIFQFKTHDYLLKHHAFSYCYSVYLALEMQRKPHADNQRLLAVAPSFSLSKSKPEELYALRSSLNHLKFNLTEAESVLGQFPGIGLSGIDATKTQFLKQSNNFGMIHLATHGKANDGEGDFSYLAFSNLADTDFRLYANEIYSLDLQSELVTLSACESGLGELQSSEGIISLARAFSFAGAKSIVSTLWSVDDQSTVDLMTGFYQNLSRSNTKDIALQQAKITYLNQVDHVDAHPFFWSAFVAVGDMSPIPKKSTRRMLYLILIISLLATIGLIYKSKRHF